MAGTVDVIYAPTIGAIVPKSNCRCEGPKVLALRPVLIKNKPSCDATLCLDCGTVRPVAATYRHYWHALSAFWQEFGWHRDIGARLGEFARGSTDSDAESFFALLYGRAPAHAGAPA